MTKRMQVGIDCTAIIYGRGVSRYTANLIRALRERSEVTLSLYGSSLRERTQLERFAHELKIPPNRTAFQPLPPSGLSMIWRLGLNPIRKQLPHLNVFHSWDWLQPPDKDLPLVSTIHDLAMLQFPDTAHPQILKMHRRSWEILKKRQAEIIAVSMATKRDIVDLLEIPAERIHVIPEALPQEFKQVSDSIADEEWESRQQKLQLDKPFLLFVGTREPRKNLRRLIEAWQPLAAEYDLIIVGDKGWDETSGPNAKFTKLKGLRFLGHASDKDLAVLYGEAAVFCYPSLYEGFGLPILEAFHHGTPVVTSAISSMPEVAGNAAELVDPQSVTSIRKGIETVLNESLPEQQKRLQKMIIRLQMFSWKRVASETIQVYQRAVARGQV